jgi:hypothetical protein
LINGEIGTKINVNPIPEVADPFIISFQDDGINSIQAPVAPDVYYYQVIAVDGSGNVSLPSNALAVSVNLPQEITPVQAKILKVQTLGN